jgi:hypothetical protein
MKLSISLYEFYIILELSLEPYTECGKIVITNNFFMSLTITKRRINEIIISVVNIKQNKRE